MNRWHAVYGIARRDLLRIGRQRSRLVGGLARPLMWLLLVGTGFNAIAQVEGGLGYRAFIFPGVVTMAALFGAMLTGVSTVYDREFGMLRLMLASPAGVSALLAGRAISGALIGLAQGVVVLAVGPLVAGVDADRIPAAIAALAVCSLTSSVLGLLIASRLRSVENYAGIINVVLFPLLFLSGALYPAAALPAGFAWVARANPVTFQVDLLRHALDRRPELPLATDLVSLAAWTVVAGVLTALLFDPEQRFVPRRPGR